MLKLHQLFFLHFLFISLATLLVGGVVSFFALKTLLIDDVETTLRQNIQTLRFASPRLEELNEIARKIHADSGIRVTVVEADGVVLAESNMDNREMENHLGRPEIMGAKSRGWGKAVRFSKSVGKQYLYVAFKTRLWGKAVYIRMAKNVDRVSEDFYTLWRKVTILVAIALLAGVFAALVLNRRIKREVEKISEMAELIGEKRYKLPKNRSYIKEFAEIMEILRLAAKKLHKRDKLKQKYEAKLRLHNRQLNEVLSAISHEFKNPVAVIAGYSETLANKEVDEPTRKRFLEKIDRNARKISDMIDRMSFAIKLERGEATLKNNRFDLLALANDAAAMLRDNYKERVIVVEGEESPVQGDKTLIGMVITNLVDNALKYSDETVRVEVKEGTLRVIDKGMGIAEEDLEQVTKKFYRVDNISWNNSMGLGLSIVTYILKLHKSELFIESEKGEGSVFSFTL